MSLHPKKKWQEEEEKKEEEGSEGLRFELLSKDGEIVPPLY